MGDFSYKTKKWKRKAEAIRKRDNYICQLCGTREAFEVHHLFPVEQYPRLAWNKDNLVTLCKNCHNRCHDRCGGGLTPFGVRLRRLYGGGGKVKVKLVTGLPCSGKIYYVMSHAGPNDLIYDYDRLMMALSVYPLHVHNPHLDEYIRAIQLLILENVYKKIRH